MTMLASNIFKEWLMEDFLALVCVAAVLMLVVVAI